MDLEPIALASLAAIAVLIAGVIATSVDGLARAAKRRRWTLSAVSDATDDRPRVPSWTPSCPWAGNGLRGVS